jgi:glutamate dehydrogenase
MDQSWKEQLQKALIQQMGPKRGAALSEKYASAFSASYLEDYACDAAVSDIAHIETLSQDHPVSLFFYLAPNQALHLRLFQFNEPLPLFDTLPMLENMDLRIINERPYKISLKESQCWISDCSVAYTKSIQIEQIKDIFQETFIQIRSGLCENDGFNKLTLSAQLSWREITILRAYAKYLRQIGFRFSQTYIEETLVNNPSITKNLVALFKTRHDPAQASDGATKLENAIVQALENVTSLDEDRIIRQMLHLIKATLRTNYFQTDEQGQPKPSLSFKLNSQAIPELPLPQPLYEIFVYSPRFEGIHLRSAKVARGGIRWSDRREDFRTEILGLMKAQKVKNAVIVPSGAKGGFVLKSLPAQAPRDVIQKEVVACYQTFICGLLDLTDNLVNGQVIHPRDMICYDDEDPYFVVAADKGTATFSDIANAISKDYQFWLGDAFASGGSDGYDHKKIGITARGAWESVKRHFHEVNINITNTHFTVVGIGDMSGDVFGNGLIYSPHIKLLAAFDHRHIFLDPHPDPVISYKERVRLFNLPTSSWEDYNSALISQGGGVYKRSVKSIPLTPEIQKALGTEETALPPNELIRVILKAPVDLLWNGGIGTYVKASTESHADVGDKTNEFCRINGNELRCRVVGEGGNLGFTQLGRIEFALQGGLINTDFIDNSAGVDCSDHEVNIKILLNQEVAKRHITAKERNTLLVEMTEEVASLVLKDNYNQAAVMSYAHFNAPQTISIYQHYIKELESSGYLNRQIEFLPDDKKITERKTAGQGLTRPELAVLLAYTKIYIKNEILKSSIPENAYLAQTIYSAFPDLLHKKFDRAVLKHSLHREIIATQLSNHIVNEAGIIFVYNLQTETGATVPEIIHAHTIASRVFGIPELQRLVRSLDFKIPAETQHELINYIRRLVNLGTRWFIQRYHTISNENTPKLIAHYTESIKTLESVVPDLMGGTTKTYMDALMAQFEKAGISPDIGRRIGAIRAMYASLNITEVATRYHFNLLKTAEVYFVVGEAFHLLWFRDRLITDSREGYWDTLTRFTLRDELDVLQKLITVAALQHNKKEENISNLITQWKTNNHRAIERWEKILEMLSSSQTTDYVMFFIALRELSNLIHASGAV